MLQVQKKSTIAAVELLTEAEAMGLDILSIPLGVTVWERFVAICTSLRQLDALYFGLVMYPRMRIVCLPKAVLI